MRNNCFLIAVLISCAISVFRTSSAMPSSNPEDTTFSLNGVAVDLRWPASDVKGFILVLPGWNFSREEVCTKSGFCKTAKAQGYCLILPEMGKSAYIYSYFNESRTDWTRYPTLRWVLDTLIPYCQNNFRILLPAQKNFLFGISTGGRGVAQIALNTGTLFTAGAALSGDYNQLLQTNDNLMTGYLGPYSSFLSRWSGRDNPSMNIMNLKIPLYLGHGKTDKVVPVEQSEVFFAQVHTTFPKGGSIIHLDEKGGHDWNYWNSEMQRIFAFFNEKLNGH
jgi:S-formylglutathione hydrolase FrmB